MKHIVLTLMMFLTSMVAFAQSEEVAMADVMRDNGKIYVVVAVMLVLFAALGVYLLIAERRIKKLEDKLGQRG